MTRATLLCIFREEWSLDRRWKGSGVTSLLSLSDAGHSPSQGQSLGTALLSSMVSSPTVHLCCPHLHCPHCTVHTCTAHTCAIHTCTAHTCSAHTCAAHTCSVHTCAAHTCAVQKVLQGLEVLSPGPSLRELAVLLRMLKLHLSMLSLTILGDSYTKHDFYIFI